MVVELNRIIRKINDKLIGINVYLIFLPLAVMLFYVNTGSFTRKTDALSLMVVGIVSIACGILIAYIISNTLKATRVHFVFATYVVMLLYLLGMKGFTTYGLFSFISFMCMLASIICVEKQKYIILIVISTLASLLMYRYLYSYFFIVCIYFLIKENEKKKYFLYFIISIVTQAVAGTLFLSYFHVPIISIRSDIIFVLSHSRFIIISWILICVFSILLVDKKLKIERFFIYLIGVLIFFEIVLLPRYHSYYVTLFLFPLIIFLCSGDVSIGYLKENIKDLKSLRINMIIILIMTVMIFAWNTDDAYHGFIMIKHFINGEGLTYNIGERVNAATNPLMLLLLCIISLITRNIEITATIFCAVCASLTFYFLVRRLDTGFAIILALITCIYSYSFIAYSTSGLENSLICLIQIIYFDYVFYHKDKYDFKSLMIISFICSLSLLTRLDTCFLLFFPTAYIFIFRRECGIFKMILAGVVGLLPLFIWFGFSIIYFGYPFPNTFYAKLRTSFPISDYIRKGADFFVITSIYDIITISTIILAVIILFKKKKAFELSIVIGIISKMIYLLRIGGDFMLGRHYTGLFIVSLFIILFYLSKENLSKSRKVKYITYTGLCILFMWTISVVIPTKFIYPNSDIGYEREYYISFTSLYKIIDGEINEVYYPISCWKNTNNEVNEKLNLGLKGDVFSFAPGVIVYTYIDDIYMTDRGALGDPLLNYMEIDYQNSKERTKNQARWRIGHMQRQIPEGYPESLNTGKNLIKDERIHRLYDKILLVVRGDIFTKERFKAIWELNSKNN